MLRKYRKKAKEGHEFLQRDIHYERDALRISLATIAFFSFVGHAVLLSFEPQVFRVLKVKNAKTKEIRKVKIDERYNCGHCNYSLQLGDKIVIKEKGLSRNIIGEVVGLPGDSVQVNKRDKGGRYLASYFEAIVTTKKIAFQRKRKGRVLTILIPREKIKGKILFKKEENKKNVDN